jgi:hypothetical protein
MRHDPDSVVQLGMAYEMGLGEKRQDRIEVVGPSLAALRVPWEKARVGGQELTAFAIDQPTSAQDCTAPRYCPGRKRYV